MITLLLASTSPRRRALLAEAGIPFELAQGSVEELDPRSAPQLAPAELARANAELKARAAWRPGRWVLGADSVIALGERIFGKPGSLAEATDFLRALSGRTHEAITGCALLDPTGDAEIFHETSRVTFRSLSNAVIADYLARVHVLDKAGAYALQEHPEMIVAKVEGSRSNIIGLPMERVSERLRARGLV